MSKTKLILIAIVALGFLLRVWQLGVVPISPDWDEASLGYNAYSVLNTGRDEYGQFLPVMLKSFGDYKPSLYTYLAIPSVAVFGLDTFAVRLPSVIAGTLSILLTFLLAEALFKNKKISLLSSLVFAVSPWSIQFSRVAFEANLGVFINLLAVLLFIKGLKKPGLLIFSGFFAALSIYSYQSEKLFVPLLIFSLILIFRKEFFATGKKYLFAFFITGLIVILPMFLAIVMNPSSLGRIESTVINTNSNLYSFTARRLIVDKNNNDYVGLILDNRRVVYLRQLAGAYLSHFDPNWLLIAGDQPRHHAPSMGLLYLWDLPFLLMGLYFLVFSKEIQLKAKIVVLAWFLIAPIPAAFTSDVPHAVRTLNFLPTYQIFTAIGIYFFLIKLKNVRNTAFRYSALSIVVLAALFNFGYFLNQYFLQQNYFTSQDWQYGYKEAVSFVNQNKSNFNQVVISDQVPMDQSYIFFLFYLKYPPAEYQSLSHSVNNHNFANFVFRNIDWNRDKNLKNTLFVLRPSDFNGDGRILKKIDYLDSTPAMEITKPL